MSIYGHTFPKYTLVGHPVGRDYRVPEEVAVALHRDYNNNPTQRLTELARKYDVGVSSVVTILLGATQER